jgi:exopolysaccharide biosynthesis polyprenyl glycosylphosphotransferase
MIAHSEYVSAEEAAAFGAGEAKGTLALGPELPRVFLRLTDTVCIVLAFLLAYELTPYLRTELLRPSSALRPWIDALAPQIGEHRPLNELLWILFVMLPMTMLALQGLGGYRPLLSQSRTRIVLTTTLAPALGLSTVALVLFALRAEHWSRLFVFMLTALSTLGLCASRWMLRLYRWKRAAAGVYAKSVAFVGSPASVKWLRLFFERMTSPTEYRVAGWFTLDTPSTALAAGREPLPCLGTVDTIGHTLVHQPIHEIIAIHGSAASEWLRELIEVCDYFRITLRIVPEALLTGRRRDLELTYHSDPLRLPEVVLRPRHLDSDALFIKRVVDIVVSGAALILLAPVFAAIALLIKIATPGLPVFYRWRVVGYKGVPFTGYKFTTMGLDADAQRDDLLARNEMQGPVFKIREDPRVTRVGRFLRKYSLNELPQLWSVLKGDMSLVGPRPAFPHELERYELWHKRKLCVRPGITCLWQVRGRNRISKFDDWVRMDLEYIDSWSLWLDIKILFWTAWAVVSGSGS